MVSLDETHMVELNPLACDSLDNLLEASAKSDDVKKQTATLAGMRHLASRYASVDFCNRCSCIKMSCVKYWWTASLGTIS